MLLQVISVLGALMVLSAYGLLQGGVWRELKQAIGRQHHQRTQHRNHLQQHHSPRLDLAYAQRLCTVTGHPFRLQEDYRRRRRLLGRQTMGKPRGTSLVKDRDVERGRGDSNETEIVIPTFIDQCGRA